MVLSEWESKRIWLKFNIIMQQMWLWSDLGTGLLDLSLATLLLSLAGLPSLSSIFFLSIILDSLG